MCQLDSQGVSDRKKQTNSGSQLVSGWNAAFAGGHVDDQQLNVQHSLRRVIFDRGAEG